MKSLFTLLFLLFTFISFSQNLEEAFGTPISENPWLPELSSENPWKAEKSEENPWISEKTEENPWGNCISESELEKENVLDSATSKTNTSDLAESKDQLAKLSLKDIKDQAYTDFNGKNSFALSFGLSMILNFYAIVPSMLVALSPSTNENLALDNFEKKYPSANKQQKKHYKKGIKNKRIGKTALGVIVGSVTQIGVILVILTAFIF